MAFKMAMTVKGFQFTDAHIEIVSVAIDRDFQVVAVGYRVYADRASAAAAPQQNVIKNDTLSLTFAELGAPLGAFYTALQAKLQALYPSATPATDAF